MAVKIDWNKKYTTYAVYAAAICAALIFLIFCGVYFSNIWDGFLHILGVLSPLIYGCIIAYIFTPIVNFFERKLLIGIKHGVVRRGVSVFNTYILFFAVITLLVYAVVPQIVRSFNDLQTTLALFTDSIQDWLNTISAQSEFMASVVEKINEVVDISALTSSLGNIIGLIYDLMAKFSPYIVGFIG
jgi:predicted PurR-regulated permease PerM